MRRSPILASLANAMLLLGASGAIVYEAVQRLQAPAPVAETTVIWVALVGILINGATALGFLAGRKDDLNIRGAFLHMVADAVVSLGVVVSGLVVLWTGWLWIDPAVSIVVALVIVVGTWSLLKEAVNLSLDAVPANIDRPAIERYLAGLPGVTEVHDLHIWAMSTTEVALTAHWCDRCQPRRRAAVPGLPRPRPPLRHRPRHAAGRSGRPGASLHARVGRSGVGTLSS
jgi:cobalt-zinc-cadmium efflux system protein